MAFDGFTLRKVINELDPLVESKVDKVFEPTENSIILGLYNGNNYMLNIDVSAVNYRLHLSTHKRKNPMDAPNFCMLLRKYLIGTKINSIYQKGLERICYIEFETIAGDNTYTLAVELMGKYSNIVLLDKDFVIIDALKRFSGKNVRTNDQDEEEKSPRQIVSKKPYIVPENKKEDITKVNAECFIEKVLNTAKYEEDEEKDIRNYISDTFAGISVNTVDEIIKNNEDITYTLNESNLRLIYEEIISIIETKKNNDFEFNFYLDDLYFEKTEEELFTQYRNNLLKVLDGTLKKITRKLDNINKKLEDSSKVDLYKLYGEILEANVYKFASGYADKESDFVELENYYDDNKLIKIEIDKNLSIIENAQKYFKKYTKLKNTKNVVEEQEKEAEKELKYIESLIVKLGCAKTVEDVDLIYEEIDNNILYNVGLNSKNKNKNKNSINNKAKKNVNKKNSGDFNLTKLDYEGYTIYVGKSSSENDYLTNKFAKEKDLWFHTKDIHGSHVILKTNGNTPKKEIIIRCAELAAFNSKAKYSSHVPVDYTEIKYVKKPKGSPLGYVIYTNNKTVYVDPKQ